MQKSSMTRSGRRGSFPCHDRIISRLREARGLTMVEMLIAALIMFAVSWSALRFYKDQHGQMMQQYDVTDTQQSLRATMEELTRKIRMAGYRAYGQNAVVILGSGTWLVIQYHDGDSLRTQMFFPFANAYTGRTDLMTQYGGQPMQVFAEGIDSVRFTPGSTGSGIEWVTVDLVARSAREGFQAPGTGAEVGEDKHLYRRLSSTVKLRNR